MTSAQSKTSSSVSTEKKPGNHSATSLPEEEEGVTITVDGEEFHFGYSRATKFIECPRAYEETYVNGHRTPGGTPMRRGTAYHATLEGLLNYKINKDGALYPLEKTENYAWKNAVKENLADGECARVVQAARFYHARLYPVHNPILVEVDFDFWKDDVRYTGKIDLVEWQNEKGKRKIFIRDHKFSYDTWAESRAKYGVQPIIYQWAWEEQLCKELQGTEFDGLEYGGFSYNIIRLFPTTVIQDVFIKPCNAVASDWWNRQLKEMARCIKNGTFYALPGDKKCQYCDHKKRCKPTIYTVKSTFIGDANEDEE